jgi:hypothetical protein
VAGVVWKPDYVPLEEAKKFVRINDTIDDTELAVIISAISRAIDRHCNRQFGKVATTETRLYTAWYDDVRERWIVDIDDLMSTSGLVVTIAGTVTTDYIKEPVNAAQELMPWTALSFKRDAATVPTGEEYEASIVAPWGWTAFPAGVPMAGRLQISRFLARRDSPLGVSGSPEQGSELRLLERLDPDVAVSLTGLVRPRMPG